MRGGIGVLQLKRAQRPGWRRGFCVQSQRQVVDAPAQTVSAANHERAVHDHARLPHKHRDLSMGLDQLGRRQIAQGGKACARKTQAQNNKSAPAKSTHWSFLDDSQLAVEVKILRVAAPPIPLRGRFHLPYCGRDWE